MVTSCLQPTQGVPYGSGGYLNAQERRWCRLLEAVRVAMVLIHQHATREAQSARMWVANAVRLDGLPWAHAALEVLSHTLGDGRPLQARHGPRVDAWGWW